MGRKKDRARLDQRHTRRFRKVRQDPDEEGAETEDEDMVKAVKMDSAQSIQGSHSSANQARDRLSAQFATPTEPKARGH